MNYSQERQPKVGIAGVTKLIKQKVKEWLSVWLFITIAAVGLVTLAVLMPFLAGHRMIEGYKEKRLFDKKEET